MNENTHTGLHPSIEPYKHGFLPPEDGHSVYFEECGSAQGLPIVFLHGGPGSGCGPKHRQLFNPATTRVVLFDQRGCGRSTADKPLHANTTAHLLHDMERLRTHLGIDRWLVVGGSWGGGLGLVYAAAHPAACLGAVIRGVFLSRPSDLQWFFHDARQCMPQAWALLEPHLAGTPAPDCAVRLCQYILQADDADALVLARAWQTWENAVTNRSYTPVKPAALDDKAATALLAKYRLQSHYLINHCFFPTDGLLSHLSPMADMPMHLVHGRLDWICLPEAAWAVRQALPHSRLSMVENAGHNPFEAPMTGVLVQAIEQMVKQVTAKG
jgi:proline iminopeptidase